jgi:hypothetical protein
LLSPSKELDIGPPFQQIRISGNPAAYFLTLAERQQMAGLNTKNPFGSHPP